VRIEERLLAEPVARQDQRAGALVPQRDPEHPVEPGEAAVAPLLVAVDDHLAVGAGGEAVAPGLEVGPQLAKVVDLAVEHGVQRAVLVAHRLAPARQIDDRQPPHPEQRLAVAIDPFVVGPAMGDGGVHRARHRLVGRRAARGRDDADDPAHGQLACPRS
jgi:hypothetical protein